MLFLSSPSLAWAKDSLSFSLSVFGGRTIIGSTDLEYNSSTSNGELENSLLNNSHMLGGKATMWWVNSSSRKPDVGLELDITTFDTTMPTQQIIGSGTFNGAPAILFVTLLAPIELESQAFALQFVGRYPIGITEALPNGRWYPYVGIGGGISRTKASWLGQSDTDLTPLLQGVIGLNLFLNSRISIFAEYKRMHAAHSFDFTGFQTNVGLTLSPNHLVAGVGVHF